MLPTLLLWVVAPAVAQVPSTEERFHLCLEEALNTEGFATRVEAPAAEADAPRPTRLSEPIPPSRQDFREPRFLQDSANQAALLDQEARVRSCARGGCALCSPP